MVDSCAGAACVYIVRHLFWCMDWIFMVGFSRFGCLFQDFLGFCYYAMPRVVVSNDIDHLTSHQENPEIELDSISICMNLNGWEVMIALGFDVAISVRVSNELGAGHPNVAKFLVVVVILTSLLICIFFMILIFVINSQEVMCAITKLATLLALKMILNSV